MQLSYHHHHHHHNQFHHSDIYIFITLVTALLRLLQLCLRIRLDCNTQYGARVTHDTWREHQDTQYTSGHQHYSPLLVRNRLRRRLRSASTAVLIVLRSKHSTIGDRAFPIAAAKVCNTLPADVTSDPSLPSFKRKLKTELVKRCTGIRQCVIIFALL